MLHIHFGAGNFGLGFAVWLFSNAGYKSIVLNRQPNRPKGNSRALRHEAKQAFENRLKEYETKKLRDNILRRDKSFSLAFLDRSDDEMAHVEIEGFYHYDQNSDIQSLRSFVASQTDSEIFVTTAVKNRAAIEDVCKVLNVIGAAAVPGRRIYVAAFENGFRSEDIKREYVRHFDQAGVTFLDAVVDRICSRMQVSERSKEEAAVLVEVESHASLVLSGLEKDDPLREILKSISAVTIADHIEPYRAVKLGLINAAHIFLAGDAQYFELPLLNNYLSIQDLEVENAPSLEDRRNHLRNVLSELSVGILGFYRDRFSEPEMSLLAELTVSDKREDVVRRFCSVADEVDRVLSRLKAPTANELHTMSDFLRSMMDKIKPPVEGYLKSQRQGPLHITESFMRIAELIAGRRFVGPVTYQ